MNSDLENLRKAWESVRERIDVACERNGRRPQSVELLAVTKTQPLEKILGLYSLGQRKFGENRVFEGLEKQKALPGDAEIHLIGHLQSNKVKEAASFSMLQSLDRAKTAIELEKKMFLLHKVMPVLLEFNTGGEENKEGIRTDAELEDLMGALGNCPHLSIRGVMTMAPFSQDEKLVRASFRTLREKAESLRRVYPDQDWSVLSMGMSNDFEWAIAEGSTMVRVGTLLFGGRS